MPFILKDSIMIPCKIDKGDVSILTISGRNIANSMKNNLNSFNNINPEFGLFSSCVTIFDINIVREHLIDYFHEKPFLMFACVGEGTYSSEKNLTYANMSINTAIFGRKNKNS